MSWSHQLRRVTGITLHSFGTKIPSGPLRSMARHALLRRWLLPRVRGLFSDIELVVPKGEAAGLRLKTGHSNPGYALGIAEPAVQDLLRTSLKPGDVFYDVGANVGFFTLIAARLIGETGTVCAFEPYPEAAELLEQTIDLNGFTNVRVIRRAIGSSRGTVRLEVDDSLTAHESTSGLLVPMISLDELIIELPPPSMIKIDVEGQEPEVLRGMAHVATTLAPIVVCEVHGDNRRDCEELLTTWGYSTSDLERDGRNQGGMRHIVGLPSGAAA